MSLVLILWLVIATVSLTLALICVLAWMAERRAHAYVVFCATALATAAATVFELGMMHSTTPAEYGEWLRWYHPWIFLSLIGQVLFVRFYLRCGRWWLVWSIIAVRCCLLVVNFSVRPNFHFREIQTLEIFRFLGEPVAVVGKTVGRPWQWLALVSLVMIVAFMFDAAIQRWRRGDAESRHKALVVAFAIGLPIVLNSALNQMVAFGVLHLPVCATLWFLGMLIAVSYKLNREFIASRRMRLQLAQLSGELAQLGRVNTLGQLSSGLAHELVQPLTAIQGNADTATLILQSSQPNLDELREIIQDIQRDNARAGEMVNRMGALIRRRAVEKQPIEMADLIRDAFALMRSEATARGVTLESALPDDLRPASGDRVQVTQVLLNVLLNAIQAVETAEREARRVRVGVSRNSNGDIETAISDSGTGIPPDKLEEIFSPLFTTKPGGMGLGLALSRTIVEAHGGRLWAENSATGRGAVFLFTLPAR